LRRGFDSRRPLLPTCYIVKGCGNGGWPDALKIGKWSATWSLESSSILEGDRMSTKKDGYRVYFTVDFPHRTIELKETENPRILVDRAGRTYDRWMVRPL